MKLLIVDDEKPARDRLRQIVADGDTHEVIGEAATGREAIDACEQHHPDVVLLDIRMPGMDGIETARHLTSLEKPPAVIFTTAYNEYALEAFDAQAVGYLMKPVRRERLERALTHAERLTVGQLDAVSDADQDSGPRTHFSARIADRLRMIPVSDVLYLQADQKYVAVGLPGEEVLIDDSLKAIEAEFGSDVFFRIHRNALVAVGHLRAIEKRSDGSNVALVHNSDKALDISRRHVASLRKFIRHGG
ncbi:MAG: LytR/AlgR family response regulator transcription factor [Gammaproteobacteria bacterium]